MFGFGKKQPANTDITVTPVSLDDAHSVAAPVGGYPAKNTQNAWTATYTSELPAVPEQDRILVHWYRPPDYGPPQPFWSDANEDKIARGKQESFQTNYWQEQTSSKEVMQNPWLNDIRGLLRPTATQSPSDFRFLRPFYPGDGYGVSTGRHFSMASNRRAYPINGMQPQTRLRNTFRLEPVARDAENTDLSGLNTAAAIPAVYVSPQSSSVGTRWAL